MSQSKQRHTAERWWKTAQEDLKVGNKLMLDGFYAHACFSAQQAGEKAVKALWYLFDQEPWGHSIQRLLLEFGASDQLADYAQCVQAGATLDRLYIGTRYPNGLPDLTPAESYFRVDAEASMATARFLMEHIVPLFK
jgi:HEPN domain-containing protein